MEPKHGIRISHTEAEELHLTNQVYCSPSMAGYYYRVDNLSEKEQEILFYRHGRASNIPVDAWLFGADKEAH